MAADQKENSPKQKQNIAYLPQVLLVALLTLMLVATAGGFGFSMLEKQVRNELLFRLNNTLPHAIKMLNIWQRDLQKDAQAVTFHKLVGQSIQQLLKKSKALRGKRNLLLESEELRNLRELLGPICENYGFVGFVLIDTSGLAVGALLDEPVGTRSLASSDLGKTFFGQALRGNTVVTHPLPAEVKLPDEVGKFSDHHSTMFVMTPIRDQKNNITSVLAFRLRPENVFAGIFEITRSGTTGETYAFNKEAYLLSRSRFEDSLRLAGILDPNPDVSSILNVKLVTEEKDPSGILQKNPDGQESLTRMAASALKGESGFDLDGYADYRGTRVVGAWTWLSEFGFGVATEIDYDEAYELLINLQKAFFALFSLLVVASVATVFLSWRQGKTQKELYNALQKAEIANAAKTEFLSKMSHELRTPMNAILGYAQLLTLYDKERLTDSQKDGVDHILKAGNHLLGLINEVLDLARVETGSIVLSTESLSLNDLVSDTISLFQPLSEERKISIFNKLDSDQEILVQADLVRLKQVLFNVVSNAIKYNKEEGSITFRGKKTPEGNVQLEIEDTGFGIATEHLPEVFEPFKRMEWEGSSIEGTGIGLSISQRLMNLMGGQILVKSRRGEGSCFTLVLAQGNIPKEEKEIKKKNLVSLPRQSPAATILYIEDNPDNLKLVRDILQRRSGIQLLSAPEARQGLDLARVHQPDLILLDINLPGMNGYDALTELKRKKETSNIPVIAISANALEEDIRRALELGFQGYLVKPINVVQFLNIIDTQIHPENPSQSSSSSGRI